MARDKTYISLGDFIDLLCKIKQKGYKEVLSKFRFSNKDRTVSKWNTLNSTSDFWIIPEVRSRWNEKSTGDKNTEYEDYVVSKIVSNSNGLRMLSVGCGSGTRERRFAKYHNFECIDGIDIASKQIEDARKLAAGMQMNNINYIVGDFLLQEFKPNSYDIVLFNSSLHHFDNISSILKTKVIPILKAGGHLVIFEYVGPNRLQWKQEQLDIANHLLKELPLKYRTRFGSHSIKKHIYRPGIWRMLLVDPSEAIDSSSIISAIHKYFKVIEEKKIGWDITHLLFKDIAHNFLKQDEETQNLLSFIFEKEDAYLTASGKSDAVFGIYQKP